MPDEQGNPIPVVHEISPDGVQLPTKLTKAKLEAYLDELAETGLLVKSADALGLHPHTVWERRKADPDFQLCVDMALERYADKLRAEVHRRGVEGWVERGLFDKDGNHLGDVRKFSDRLLELHAKRLDPSYRENIKVDASVDGKLSGNHTHTHTAVPMADLKKLNAQGRAALRTVLLQMGAKDAGER